jgi:hypothetical protein
MLLTLGIFLGGLALVWTLGRGHSRPTREQAFTFPLNNTIRHVQVRSILHDAASALVIDGLGGRSVLVEQAAPRAFTTLLVEWTREGRRMTSQLRDGSRKLGHLFDTFRVLG